jgi:hypothetical protein
MKLILLSLTWLAFVQQGRAHDEFPSAAEAADSGGTCMPRLTRLMLRQARACRLVQAPSCAKIWSREIRSFAMQPTPVHQNGMNEHR